MLRAIVSEYRLDDLLWPAEPTRDPRKEIREQITARLKPVLMQQGVKMLGLGIGLFLPQGFDADKAFDPEKPVLDDVTAQRIKAWKAEWESRMIQTERRSAGRGRSAARKRSSAGSAGESPESDTGSGGRPAAKWQSRSNNPAVLESRQEHDGPFRHTHLAGRRKVALSCSRNAAGELPPSSS